MPARLTPTDYLSIHSGIQDKPADFRLLRARLSLAKCGTLDPDHILHSFLSGFSNTRQARVRFRCPFVPGAQKC